MFLPTILLITSQGLGQSIQSINALVKTQLQKESQLESFVLSGSTKESEGNIPKIVFYFQHSQMQLSHIKITKHHEIFSTTDLFVYSNKNLIKYSKEYTNHPEKPEKKAVIYNSKGKKLWENTNFDINESQKLVKLFDILKETLQEYR